MYASGGGDPHDGEHAQSSAMVLPSNSMAQQLLHEPLAAGKWQLGFAVN